MRQRKYVYKCIAGSQRVKCKYGSYKIRNILLRFIDFLWPFDMIVLQFEEKMLPFQGRREIVVAVRDFRVSMRHSHHFPHVGRITIRTSRRLHIDVDKQVATIRLPGIKGQKMYWWSVLYRSCSVDRFCAKDPQGPDNLNKKHVQMKKG